MIQKDEIFVFSLEWIIPLMEKPVFF